MKDIYIEKLKEGESSWNKWRIENPEIRPILRNINFTSIFPNTTNIYNLPSFENANFSNCDLHGVVLRNGTYTKCTFDCSDINWADLVDAYFYKCSFRNVCMRVTKIGSATFSNCIFENSDLSYCSAEETNFTGSEFLNSKLEHMSLVKCDFTDTKLDTCFVYGTSTWDLNLENSIQQNLIITSEENDIITVDNLELAQFLYLLINNKKLRDVIETITSRVVLIPGNFSTERKRILEYIKSILRKNDYIPVMFDFEKPSSRNFTETIVTLASMSKFIIADLSSPRSLPHELSALIPRMQSINIYPIIKRNEKPYGMFEDFKIYRSVKEIKEYNDNDVDKILSAIIDHDQKRSV